MMDLVTCPGETLHIMDRPFETDSSFTDEQLRALWAIFTLIKRKIQRSESDIKEGSYTVFCLPENTSLDVTINQIFYTVLNMPSPMSFKKIVDFILFKKIEALVQKIKTAQKTIEQWNITLADFERTYQKSLPLNRPYREALDAIQAQYKSSPIQILIRRGKDLGCQIRARVAQKIKKGISKNATHLITCANDVEDASYIQDNISDYHKRTGQLLKYEKYLRQDQTALSSLLDAFKKAYNRLSFHIDDSCPRKAKFMLGCYQYLEDPPSEYSEAAWNFSISEPKDFTKLFNVLVEKEGFMKVQKNSPFSFNEIEYVMHQWTPCRRKKRVEQDQALCKTTEDMIGTITEKTNEFQKLNEDLNLKRIKVADAIQDYHGMDFKELSSTYDNVDQALSARIAQNIDHTISADSFTLLALSHDESIEEMQRAVDDFRASSANFKKLQERLHAGKQAMNGVIDSFIRSCDLKCYIVDEGDLTLWNEIYFNMCHFFGSYQYTQQHAFSHHNTSGSQSTDSSYWSFQAQVEEQNLSS